jgi:hypothetical protein
MSLGLSRTPLFPEFRDGRLPKEPNEARVREPDPPEASAKRVELSTPLDPRPKPPNGKPGKVEAYLQRIAEARLRLYARQYPTLTFGDDSNHDPTKTHEEPTQDVPTPDSRTDNQAEAAHNHNGTPKAAQNALTNRPATHGEKGKARDIIQAIRTLKCLEDEHRPATDDEKAVLSRFGGFGIESLK